MFFDFVEVGTSDFNTLIQKADDNTVGLSIDPIELYLNNLPNPKKCTKINAAVSNYDGTTTAYYIPPDTIAKHRLPDWIRGCNSIGLPHPTVDSYINNNKLDRNAVLIEKTIPAYKLTTIFQLHNVTGLFFLKTDTEGHDSVIINKFFDEASKAIYPHRILFESNCLSNNEDIHNLIVRLITLGYDIISAKTGGGDTDTFLKLNINRLKNKTGFTETITGYYLTDYPKNYNPQSPPHENTLESAVSYCIQNHCGGVTYQYGRFEVRKGDYLMHSTDDNSLKSWVFC